MMYDFEAKQTMVLEVRIYSWESWETLGRRKSRKNSWVPETLNILIWMVVTEVHIRKRSLGCTPVVFAL